MYSFHCGYDACHSVEETSRTFGATSRSLPSPGPVSAFGDSAGCQSHSSCRPGLDLVPRSVSMCLLLSRKNTNSEFALSLLYCCSRFIYLVLNHVFTLLSTLTHPSLETHPLSLRPCYDGRIIRRACVPFWGPFFRQASDLHRFLYYTSRYDSLRPHVGAKISILY